MCFCASVLARAELGAVKLQWCSTVLASGPSLLVEELMSAHTSKQGHKPREQMCPAAGTGRGVPVTTGEHAMLGSGCSLRRACFDMLVLLLFFVSLFLLPPP